MSRCYSCDVPLSQRELTRKYKHHEQCKTDAAKYIGLCTHCCHKAGIYDYVDSKSAWDNRRPECSIDSRQTLNFESEFKVEEMQDE